MVKMTQYSHGSGCGCKISPGKLSEILHQSTRESPLFANLLVGNESRDDAAAFALGDGRAIISTTDFFMPIVDDPREFGEIAATNAISDVYAMGGTPLLAIAIFGWPMDKLSTTVAAEVIDGGRQVCHAAGIPLAGGHSIDSPEPIFGLAVTGIVDVARLKQNSTAVAGCRLYLTKPLGIGIYTTAEKQGKLRDSDRGVASGVMRQLNQVGSQFARLPGVTAMTDVTGFGLMGHLLEICQGSSVAATLDYAAVPRLEGVEHYLKLGCSPGGAQRNFDSYGHHLAPLSEPQRQLLCDPQTSGGLLLAVTPESEADLLAIAATANISLTPIGTLQPHRSGTPWISLR
ncbi:MAG: selenide, water dikinase SelD [Gammaproteobacteria bacterium]|nr:selenide, water dikinase SelD [Gammaproteobacteria bacterium]